MKERKLYVSYCKRFQKKSYGSTSNKVEVLKGINFEVEKGEICVLLGPSGSGKINTS